jgi:hypothetical protein
MTSATIPVFVRSPTGSGRLYPSYDAEADILSVSSRIPREWPYGIDIDGNLVFDLDQDRILANFDLLIGHRLWTPGEAGPWPKVARPADLGFEASAIKTKSFHLPLNVMWDQDRSFVRIILGLGHYDRVAALSEQCVALLDRDTLAGFLVRL